MTQLSLDYCVPMNFERPIKMHGVNKICPVIHCSICLFICNCSKIWYELFPFDQNNVV